MTTTTARCVHNVPTNSHCDDCVIDAEDTERLLRAPAPQPEQDAGEQWHEWKHEEHNGKHGIFEGNLLIAVVGECVARPEYAPAYAAQICADHRSAAAVPKLIQAAQNLLEYAAGLLLCLEARGVALGEGPQMQAAKTAIDEALTTVNQTGGE